MQQGDNRLLVYKLARFGAFSIGVVYVLIGVVAILSLLRIKRGGADASSVLNYIKGIPLGEVLIAFILLGMVGYIIWRLYDAINDPYNYGSSFKGIAIRIGIALSALAYGFIVFSGVEVLLGLSANTHGQPVQERFMVAEVFQWKAGKWLVSIVGVMVAFTGLADIVFVIKEGYKEKLKWNKFSATQKRVVTVLVWAGHFARGIIFLIIGYFLIKASVQSDPFEVVNTDKAFNFLGNHVSHLAFVLVAVGIICYGWYMFALGVYHDFDEDI